MPDEGGEDSRAVSRVLLAPIKHIAEEEEAIGAWIRAANNERNREELKRLLYVGCTRARMEVHLFVQGREGKNGELGKARVQTLLHTAWPVAEAIFAQHLSERLDYGRGASKIVEMPSASAVWPSSKLSNRLESIAASGDAKDVNRMIRLSNFHRLPSDWQPPATFADIPMTPASTQFAEIGEDVGEEMLPVFQRPQGSWQARVFGTVLHAFLEPLANILAQNAEPETQARAIDALVQPIRLQLLSSGHPPMDAGKEAARIVAALHDVAADENGRWILAIHPSPLFPEQGPSSSLGFEVPLTGIFRNAIRSVRVDRMFLAGAASHDQRYGSLVDYRLQNCFAWVRPGGGILSRGAQAVCGADAGVWRYCACRVFRSSRGPAGTLLSAAVALRMVGTRCCCLILAFCCDQE